MAIKLSKLKYRFYNEFNKVAEALSYPLFMMVVDLLVYSILQ